MAILENDGTCGCDHCKTPWTDAFVYYETYDQGFLCEACIKAGVSTQIVRRGDETGEVLS